MSKFTQAELDMFFLCARVALEPNCDSRPFHALRANYFENDPRFEFLYPDEPDDLTISPESPMVYQKWEIWCRSKGLWEVTGHEQD